LLDVGRLVILRLVGWLRLLVTLLVVGWLVGWAFRVVGWLVWLVCWFRLAVFTVSGWTFRFRLGWFVGLLLGWTFNVLVGWLVGVGCWFVVYRFERCPDVGVGLLLVGWALDVRCCCC